MLCKEQNDSFIFLDTEREKSDMFSHFSFSELTCKLNVTGRTHRETAHSHTWLEPDHIEINVLLCAVACQQRILLDSLCRAFPVAVCTEFNCTLPAKIKPIPVNLSNVYP